MRRTASPRVLGGSFSFGDGPIPAPARGGMTGLAPPARMARWLAKLIEAPVDAIDYVITHELCHIAEPNHGAAFYELLDRVLPDWQHRKQRQERIMA